MLSLTHQLQGDIVWDFVLLQEHGMKLQLNQKNQCDQIASFTDREHSLPFHGNNNNNNNNNNIVIIIIIQVITDQCLIQMTLQCNVIC